jgi:uncharacterized membrane protein YdbT with pleckstrin-like domain
MAELEIRPTLRFVILGYLAVAGLLVAAIVWWNMEGTPVTQGAVAVAAILFLWPVIRHVQARRVRCKLEGANLRYEEGLVSTTVRTIPVANVQDVTVRRGLVQRIWGLGDLRIETAGDSAPVEIDNVESPQTTADRVLAARGTASGQGQGSVVRG